MDCMERLAPKNLAESWDNPGLMVGDESMEVKKILFALDCSERVIDEAISLGADMIVTHHPMIFKGIKNVTKQTPLGKKIFKAIQNNISVYSAHTNLDIAEGGTNTTLANLIGLENIEPLLDIDNNTSIGKCGLLRESIKFGDFISEFKKKLGTKTLIVNGILEKNISKIGLCTGKASSAEYLYAAKSKNCDLYITGDIGYHDAQVAEDLDICLIDGTHYLTEVIVVPVIAKYVGENVEGVECLCSKVNGQTLIAI